MSRTYTYLAVLVGLVCGYFLIRSFVFDNFFDNTRTVRNDVVQGILIGAGLAFVTAQVYARIKAKKVNGWITVSARMLTSTSMEVCAGSTIVTPRAR